MDPLDPLAALIAAGRNQTPSPTGPSQSQMLADALDAYGRPGLAASSLGGAVTSTPFGPDHAAALANALDAYARPGAANASPTPLPFAAIPTSFDDPIGLGRLLRRQTGTGPAGISPIPLSATANGPQLMAAHLAALPLQQGAGPHSGGAPQPAAAPTQAPTTVAPITVTGVRQPWYVGMGQRIENLIFGQPRDADSLNRSDWGRFAHTDGDNANPPAAPTGQPVQGPAPQTLIHAIPGYDQTGKNAWRAANDPTFLSAADAYNTRYGLLPGMPGYMSADRLKAWAMVETGGEHDRDKFLTDPLQVNNSGDWKAPKPAVTGLTEGQTMTPASSAEAALKWLRYKGYHHDAQGREDSYRGDARAFERYNGKTAVLPGSPLPHNQSYARQVMSLGDAAANDAQP